MTDSELVRHLTEKMNIDRRAKGLSEITEAEVRYGLELIGPLASAFTVKEGQS